MTIDHNINFGDAPEAENPNNRKPELEKENSQAEGVEGSVEELEEKTDDTKSAEPETASTQDVLEEYRNRGEGVTASELFESNDPSMDAPIDPEKEIETLDASLKETDEKIDTLEKALKDQDEGLKSVRETLGLETPHNPEGLEGSLEAQIAGLKKQKEKIEENREDAENTKELEAVLKLMKQLPPAELKIIIETGKGANGEELKTKKGKIDPEVAKKLAEAAKNGAEKLTKAILGAVIGVVAGVLSGIFSALFGGGAPAEGGKVEGNE